jgi:choline dehydrogenase
MMTDHEDTSPNATASIHAATPARRHHRDSYDFIVCGAGSSGCVVAARLAENPDAQVLLVEAGGDDDIPEVMTPGSWPANLGSARDWAFTAQPNPHLNGRVIPLSMGKVLGGGSSINVMVWARGHKNDWESFAAEAGDPAWGYESVLGIYRRIENWRGPADPLRRGVAGPVHVETAVDPQPTARAMVQAANALGVPAFDSPNGEMMEGRGGIAINDLIVRDGRRMSMFRAYVQPRRGQSNLTVLTHALVTRLIFAERTVIGVEILQGGVLRRCLARHEVVLSLGAINTPKLLMQSGVGPDPELRHHGIPTIPLASARTIRTTSRSAAFSNTRRRSRLVTGVRKRRSTGRPTQPWTFPTYCIVRWNSLCRVRRPVQVRLRTAGRCSRVWPTLRAEGR